MEGVSQIGHQLLNDRTFIQKLWGVFLGVKGGSGDRSALEIVIEQVTELLGALIRQKLELEMQELIQDNNRILMEIKQSVSREVAEESSFSEVHRLINEEKKRLDEPSDADLERSISTFVDLKFQTLEDKVTHLDRRLRSMQDKYQTNLKSIWNVLSITEGAVFDHIKLCKDGPEGKGTREGQQLKQKQHEDDKNDKRVKQRKGIFGLRLW